MKKKIAMLITLLLLCLAASGMFACGCRHEVFRWKVKTEATCTSNGVRYGICSLCGEVVEEPTEPIAENHVYTDWEITKAPTYERDGKGEATKICKEDSSHYIKVTLPRLSESYSGYKYHEIVKEATVLSDGKLALIYESEYGDIIFTITIGKKEFYPTGNPDIDPLKANKETVYDAVLLGSSNKDLIRRGTASIKLDLNGDESIYGASYEYGEGYTKTDNGSTKLWAIQKENGGVFGVIGTSGYTNVEEYANIRKDHLNGYEYKISFAGKTFFGAEGLLKYSYEWGAKDTNQDFTVQITEKEDNGITRILYKFSFCYFNVPSTLNKVEAEFTLTDEYAIDYIKLSCDTYVQSQFEISEVENKTVCKLKTGCGEPKAAEYIIYNQILKKDAPEEPVHEYNENSLKISDFDVCYRSGGDYIAITEDKETAPQLVAGGGNSILKLYLNNVQPSTANFSLDGVVFYRVLSTGRYVPVDFAYSTSNPVWAGSFNETSCTIDLRAKTKGYVTLAARTTSGAEKRFVINVLPCAPSALYPCYYEYGDNGYSWKESVTKNIAAQVYVGQSLSIRTKLSIDEQPYAESGFTPSLGIASDYASVSYAEGAAAAEFVATKAGTYTVRLRSIKGKAECTVTITVIDPPNVTEMLVGSYTAKLKKGNATIVFGEEDGAIIATVTTNKGEEVLTVSYDAVNKELITEHESGAELGVTLELNEAYKIVLANPTGFGSGKERVVIYAVEPPLEELPVA